MDTLISPLRRRMLAGLGGIGALALTGYALRPAAAGAAASFEGPTMGGRYVVRIAGPALSAARLEAAQADVHAALDGVDRRMSLWRTDSELAAFNASPAGHVALSAEMFEVLRTAQAVARLSDGAFDVSVAPLVRAWGFGPDPRAGLPGADLLAARRGAVGHEGLALHADGRVAVKARDGLQIDLGGVAKGYGVDRAAAALEALGIGDYMVEAGGEVRARGVNAEGRPWRIGVEEPDAMPRRARLVVALDGAAMATSGDYRNYFVHEGRRFSHGIDPATGAPVAHGLASVSVVAADCARADALATALMVMEPGRGRALAERAGLAAHFILRRPDGGLQDHATPAFAALRAA